MAEEILEKLKELKAQADQGDIDPNALSKAMGELIDLQEDLGRREEELSRREEALEFLSGTSTGLEDLETVIKDLESRLKSLDDKRERILGMLEQLPKLVSEGGGYMGQENSEGDGGGSEVGKGAESDEFWDHMLLMADFVALEVREEALRRSEKELQDKIKSLIKKK